MFTHIPFKTPEGEARFGAAYDAALKLSPVPGPRFPEEEDGDQRGGTEQRSVA